MVILLVGESVYQHGRGSVWSALFSAADAIYSIYTATQSMHDSTTNSERHQSGCLHLYTNLPVLRHSTQHYKQHSLLQLSDIHTIRL